MKARRLLPRKCMNCILYTWVMYRTCRIWQATSQNRWVSFASVALIHLSPKLRCMKGTLRAWRKIPYHHWVTFLYHRYCVASCSIAKYCPCFLRPLSWASISYKSNTFESRFRCCSFTWSMRLGVALSMGLLGWRSFSCWHYVWLYANFILYSCIQFLLGVWCDWLCSNLRGLLQKLLKRLSINALEFEMLLAGMDGGEADGNSDGIDAKQAVWFYGGPPKVGKFQR